MAGRSQLTISQLSARSGAAPSALRYYEQLGLIEAAAHIRPAAPLPTAHAAARRLHPGGTPARPVARATSAWPSPRSVRQGADESRLEPRWRARGEKGIDAKIAELERSSSRPLASCIGCGCLSLRRCALYNRMTWPRGRGPGRAGCWGTSRPPDALPAASGRPRRPGRPEDTARRARPRSAPPAARPWPRRRPTPSAPPAGRPRRPPRAPGWPARPAGCAVDSAEAAAQGPSACAGWRP